jgi:ABC-type polysaccharide/polyol phosphate export permease
MNELVKKSLPTKLAALGFIFMILMGNYWMVLVITNQPYPQWLMDCFLIAALWIIGCAVCIAYLSFRYRDFVSSEGDKVD